MLKKDLTLSDVVDYFKKNKIPSFEEEIDEYGGYFITAARIASVILAPSPIVALANFCSGIDAASLRVSKLFSWLPDKFKYGHKGRERFAIDRYQVSSIINLKLLDIAILNSFNDSVVPLLEGILKDIVLTESDKLEIGRLSREAEANQLNVSIDTFNSLSKEEISNIAFKIIDPLFPFLIKISRKNKDGEKRELDLQKVQVLFINKIYTLYNAFLINFSSEFPEFSLWYDIQEKSNIANELVAIKKHIRNDSGNYTQLLKIHENFAKSINNLIEKIELLKDDKFVREEGFPSFDITFTDLFEKQTESIINKLDEKVRNNIIVHQNVIKGEIEKLLSDNVDIKEIVYPKNKEIYIAQSFQAIVYRRTEHKKGFLTSSSIEGKGLKGEDIGKFLLQKIVDPNTMLTPIIILGNPGAGKSMFSKMFAAKLCATHDFMPFLIRLRDVASSSSHLSEHINRGIAKSINNTNDINWIDWANLFKERIPVIILDGFDELMQSSKIVLNGYITTIKELQEAALHYGICLRVILTSRISVMQDVAIPDGTNIIKLNPFDEKRKNLWVEKWNSFQKKKKYKFSLPKNDKIQELAQEPLLLFMLAVYDFPAGELQALAKDKLFNQSKLYDSLLNSFGVRQLEKEDNYTLYCDATQKKQERELFRLRLGMIALLMFLNDSTNKDIQRLEEELKICRLSNSSIKPIDVLTGFFFVHQNKATSENDVESYNYEFLHKSFGEFLAADFILRIAAKQSDRKTRDEELFQICFGYNWLNKHPEILKFLFEHASQIFDLSKNEQRYIVEEINEILAEVFGKTVNSFPVTRFTILDPRSKIEHIAIYSQNLILLWLALTNSEELVKFNVVVNVPNQIEHTKRLDSEEETINYTAQDVQELNVNKLLWKRIASLWQLAGNYEAVAKVFEWIEIIENDEDICLRKRVDIISIKHNFSDAAIVACNDFNFIISLYDNEVKLLEATDILKKVDNITKKKPELSSLAKDALIHRFSDLCNIYGKKIAEFLIENNLLPRQHWALINQLINNDAFISPSIKFPLAESLFARIYSDRNLTLSALKLMRYLIPYATIEPVKRIFAYTNINEIFNQLSQSILEQRAESRWSVIREYFKLIIELNNAFPSFRFNRNRMLEEIIHKTGSDFIYTVREYPGFLSDFLEVLKTADKGYIVRNVLNRSSINDWLEDLSYKLDVDNDFHSATEVLNFVYELNELLPIEEIFDQSLVRRLIENIRRQFGYISRENPVAALRYLGFLTKINKYYPIVKNFEFDFWEDIFESLITDIRHDHVLNDMNSLKLINELVKTYPLNYNLRSSTVSELARTFIDEFKYLLRDNPKLVFRYLSLFKSINDQMPLRHIVDINRWNEMFEISLVDFIRDDIRHPEYLFIYVKILNEAKFIFDSRNFLKSATPEFLHRVDNDFNYLLRKQPDRAIEYLKLLYNLIDEPDLINLLRHNQKIYELYQNNPATFFTYFDTFLNIVDYERRY